MFASSQQFIRGLNAEFNIILETNHEIKFEYNWTRDVFFSYHI